MVAESEDSLGQGNRLVLHDGPQVFEVDHTGHPLLRLAICSPNAAGINRESL